MEPEQTIKTVLPHLQARGDQIAKTFLTDLLKRDPSLERIFAGTQEEVRQRLIVGFLTTVGENLANESLLGRYLQKLGRQARQHAVRGEHLSIAADAMLFALRDACGPTWSAELEKVWFEALVTTIQYVQEGLGPETSARVEGGVSI